ncbi:hypothetical protein ABZS68_32345 [Streptomyces sp. NPDC005571]|uniref:HNH endonuclease n=1 Tax=Streptomyces sp. NPDC005571 TaxID=3156888 RepID=UPI0033ADAAD4
MWSLEPPSISARRSYETCVASTKDFERRQKLLAGADSVEDSGGLFRQAAYDQTLHDLEQEPFKVPGIKDSDVVTWAYENGMVNTKNGRRIYDEIMAAPMDERCPLCGHGIVRTLDHYLPKKAFPALCVDPLNLVPACSDCNHVKGESVPASTETTPLHPYFDRIDDVLWLQGRVVQGSPMWLEFFVGSPPSWDPPLISRTRHHFELFGLARLYAVQANRTVSNIRRLLAVMLDTGGSDVVRDYLRAEARTRLAVRLNGWEGVTYRTLAEDDAFCSGGFLA